MPRSIHLLAPVLLATFLAACAPPPPADPSGAAPAVEIETDEQKTLYALGVTISQGLQPFTLDDDELPYVQQGIADAVRGRDLKVDMLEYSVRLQMLAVERMNAVAEAEAEASAAFLEERAADPQLSRLESGLLYTEITTGDGASPDADDIVTVNYHGSLRNGIVFDTSRGKSPARMSVAQAIPCWREALQRMQVGGTSRFVCPPELAYGSDGAPPAILPNAALVFDVELLEVTPFAAPVAAPPSSDGP